MLKLGSLPHAAPVRELHGIACAALRSSPRTNSREQQAGFGVGQQQSSETGTRKIGIDARTELAERWNARGEAFRQNSCGRAAGADQA